MKKITAIIFSFFVTLCFTGCFYIINELTGLTTQSNTSSNTSKTDTDTDKDKDEDEDKDENAADAADVFLSIKKAVLASNGKLYAFGNNSLTNPRCNLWRMDTVTNGMENVKTFGDEISDIAELESGVLFVSHGKTISKLNLETNETIDFVVLDGKILAIENYKNDYIIAVCSSNKDEDRIRLVKKASGDIQKISGRDDSYHLGQITNFLYIPEIDMYVFDTKGLSPNDLNYLVIDDSDSENLSYLSYDSVYHGDSNGIDGPYTVFDTDSSQKTARVIASGEVFEINRNAALSSDYDELQNWCKTAAGVSCIQHQACYILGENIYYVSQAEDNFHDVLVKKYSKTSTSDVFGSKTFKNKKAVNFFYHNSQLYLLTNSTYSADGYNDYKVYLHRIDF